MRRRANGIAGQNLMSLLKIAGQVLVSQVLLRRNQHNPISLAVSDFPQSLPVLALILLVAFDGASSCLAKIAERVC